MTWYVSWILFKIYATEAHLFPVQPPFTEESDECLPKVLNSNPPLIIKYLALQDLMLLSQYSPSRRQEVFSLSQPGGHPHNWTAISRECLNLLNDMTQKLVLYQEAAATNGRVMSSSYTVEPKKLNSPEETTFQTPKSSQMPRSSVPPLVKTSLFSSKLSTPDVASPLGSPFGSSVMNRMAGIFDANTCYRSPQSSQLIKRGPRLWTSASDQQMNEFSNLPSIVSAEGKTMRQPSVIYSWIQNKHEQIKHFLSKRVLIMYFFSKHPEASIQAVFSDAQMHIWALEGLSHLVAASFTEDRFGVVQTTLPAILNTLLTLQEAVDKYFKLPHASSKPPRISGTLVDTSYKTLRFAFRASLKTAIYRITTTFGEHLNAVQASAEHQKRLQQFLEFKE
nr:NDC1 transmembrane nucleoporin [Molossus molossus]